MARARNIKPGFYTNDVLAECEPLARILFSGLWCFADREGRLEDRPKKIKAEILPYDECNADDLLNQLEKHGFILRYTVGEYKYIQVLNFNKHQNPHVKESASTIPAPDEHSARTVQAEEKPERAGLIPDSLNPITDSKENHAPEKSPAFVLPDWIDSEKWALWMKTRKGKKMIPDQMRACVVKLEKWKNAGLDYAGALADAADGGWQGLHEPKSKHGVTSKHTALVDSNRAAADEWLRQSERVVS